MAAQPIALLGKVWAQTKGYKDAETRWFNPFEQAKYVRRAKQLIPISGARTFVRLYERRKIPVWVVAKVDLELIKAAASK